MVILLPKYYVEILFWIYKHGNFMYLSSELGKSTIYMISNQIILITCKNEISDQKKKWSKKLIPCQIGWECIGNFAEKWSQSQTFLSWSDLFWSDLSSSGQFMFSEFKKEHIRHAIKIQFPNGITEYALCKLKTPTALFALCTIFTILLTFLSKYFL